MTEYTTMAENEQMENKQTAADKLIQARADLAEAQRQKAQALSERDRALELAREHKSEASKARADIPRRERSESKIAELSATIWSMQKDSDDARQSAEREASRRISEVTRKHQAELAQAKESMRSELSRSRRESTARIKELELTLADERTAHAAEIRRLSKVAETHQRDATEARAKLEANDGAISQSE